MPKSFLFSHHVGPKDQLRSPGLVECLADESPWQPRSLNDAVLLLVVVFDEYKRISQKDIEQSIKSETSGSFEDALLAIGELVGTELILLVFLCSIQTLSQRYRTASSWN